MATEAGRPKKTALILAQRLAQDISRDGRKVGDRLPTEVVMRETYDAGRGTLRESLRFLELQGVIDVRSGYEGGPVVADPDVHGLETALTLLLQMSSSPFRTIAEARSGLEPVVTRLAAGRMGPDTIDELRATVLTMREDLEDLTCYLAQNYRFHALIAESSGNPMLEFLVKSLTRMVEGAAKALDYPIAQRRIVLAAHQRVCDAIEAGDPGRAAAAMNGHIEECLMFTRTIHPEVSDAGVVWGASDVG